MTRVARKYPLASLWVIGVTVITLSCVVAIFIVGKWVSRVAAQNAKEAAIRVALANAEYEDCIHSIPSLGAISKHVAGVNDLARILVANARASLEAAAPNDPLNLTRVENLQRLMEARAKIAAVTHFDVPTRHVCAARRDLRIRGHR